LVDKLDALSIGLFFAEGLFLADSLINENWTKPILVLILAFSWYIIYEYIQPNILKHAICVFVEKSAQIRIHSLLCNVHVLTYVTFISKESRSLSCQDFNMRRVA
jgi:hypothetical protein